MTSVTVKKHEQIVLSISMSMGVVGAPGDPCTANIFRSVVCPHLYSASSPVPLTKYSTLHNGISS
jgi:hypothetical protein